MARSKLSVRLVAAVLSIVGSAAQLGLVGTALALSVAAAHAAAPASQLVRYAELDLDRPAGVVLLHGRIQAAAQNVCGNPQRSGSRLPSAVWRACVATTVARTVARVDHPALSAYHASRQGAAGVPRGAPLAARLGRD